MTAVHDSVMTFLMHKGISGATAKRAFSGFGSRQMLHTPEIEVLTQRLPIRIEFVDKPERWKRSSPPSTRWFRTA
jgi:PII-like signaling protein